MLFRECGCRGVSQNLTQSRCSSLSQPDRRAVMAQPLSLERTSAPAVQPQIGHAALINLIDPRAHLPCITSQGALLFFRCSSLLSSSSSLLSVPAASASAYIQKVVGPAPFLLTRISLSLTTASTLLAGILSPSFLFFVHVPKQ